MKKLLEQLKKIWAVILIIPLLLLSLGNPSVATGVQYFFDSLGATNITATNVTATNASFVNLYANGSLVTGGGGGGGASLSGGSGAIYLNQQNGTAGTNGTIGQWYNPVSNLADAITIAAANKTDTIVLVGNGSINFTSGGTWRIIGNPNYNIALAPGVSVNFTNGLVCRNFIAGYYALAGCTINITGDFRPQNFYGHTGVVLFVAGDFITWGDTANDVNMDDQGDMYVYGNLNCYNPYIWDGEQTISGDFILRGSFTKTGMGTTTILGNMYAQGQLDISFDNANAWFIVKGNYYGPSSIINSTLGKLTIQGDVVAKTIQSGVAQATQVYIGGDCRISTYLGAGHSGSVFSVNGTLTMYGTLDYAGTMTWRGQQNTTAVNTIASNVSANTVFNFGLLPGNRIYTVNQLILKVADPGADNVTVMLYERVNGSDVITKTFTITQAGTNPYTGYYTLRDMFGRDTLVGHILQVTVNASAGAYAVTGQYEFSYK